MHKRGVAIIGVFMLVFSLSMTTFAATGRRREQIRSKGTIDFENGKVLFSANDLNYLADEIDRLEDNYKINIVNALSSIGTFFQQDGTIVHNSSANGVETDEKKVALTMENLKNGIMQSQSIADIQGTQAINKDGNFVFFSDEEAKKVQDYLQTTTQDTGFPVYYNQASANNLTAGVAAWVNGVLVMGNGADNAAFQEKGYREGYSQGVADSIGKANIVYTYHQHTGNSSEVGGCYGYLTGIKPVYCGCDNYVYAVYEPFPGQKHDTCGNCWHFHSGTCTAVVSNQQYDYIGITCGKTTDTIEAATIVY